MRRTEAQRGRWGTKQLKVERRVRRSADSSLVPNPIDSLYTSEGGVINNPLWRTRRPFFPGTTMTIGRRVHSKRIYKILSREL